MASPYIEDLIDIGADAMSNMFEVEFNLMGIQKYSQIQNQLKVRIAGFTPPDPKQTTYDVHYRTVSIKKAASKIELERKQTYTFRLDSNYVLYKALREYRNLYCDPTKDYAETAMPTFVKNSTIKVRALSTSDLGNDRTARNLLTTGTKDKTLTWIFNHPWIESLKLSEYTTDDSKPQTVTVEILYSSYEEN